MPDSPTGVYTLPPGYHVATGDTADPSQHNPPFEDVAQAITNRLHTDGRTSWTGNQNANGFKITGLANGTNSGDAATVDQISGIGLPLASIIDYAGSTAPNGWILCDGRAVSRSTFSALFAAIGTTYGIGNGSTTFNVPDLRGRVVAGLDDMGGNAANLLTSAGGVDGTTRGAAGGVQTHTLTEAQLPSVTKNVSITDPGHSHKYDRHTTTGGGSGPAINQMLGSDNATTTSSTTGITGTVSFGSGNAHPNVQPTMVMNKIIKAL